MHIAVVGTGYVGLVTGTCLAEMGNSVICIDNDEDKVNRMKSGEVPIYEPHLNILFERNIKAKRLRFTTSLEEALDFGNIVFLALPTPEKKDGSADLSYITKVVQDIGDLIEDYKVIVNKSTVPVGTAKLVKEIISKRTSVDFDVVSNPEFLREGVAVDDFLRPERVVIGSSSQKAIEIMKRLFKPYLRNNNPIFVMDEASAEITKYASNSFLATKITFMNEIANFCERVGANVDMVRTAMGADQRIGKQFLYPGIGYGGACFPKDLKALHKLGKDYGYNFAVLDAVIKVNEKQKVILFPSMESYFKNDLKAKKIAVWGLSFKPETDDIREAPSLYMIDELLKKGSKINAFDPEAIPNVRRKYGNKLQYGKDMYDVVEGADALLICTEWAIFRNPNFERIKSLMNVAVIFDGRNLFDTIEMKELGIYYQSIGR
ncbi:UDP-glucose 6-dehydrogenase [Elysia marginata]|uniref:UDP-glucose 6-dehydrogenase n=1 Tax=Elysia marginata TaxID=1093978 RepID=A0AAV4G4T3_9GAST|nr:UDP-glucose 6-dehydrogenase [Elysia marginata]